MGRPRKGTGEILQRGSFRGAWDNACEAAGCPGRLLHDFRRTAVRNLDLAGVSRRVAMQMVGHKTESIYNPLPDHQRQRSDGRGGPAQRARDGINGIKYGISREFCRDFAATKSR